MGQYFKIVNENKKEVVNPWKLGGGAKFFEWLYNNQARVLIWLVRKSNETGGGDIDDFTTYQTLGRWAGDRITLIGDYDESRLWDTADEFTDISTLVRDEYNHAVKADGFEDEFGL
jgi:hypothetical protein